MDRKRNGLRAPSPSMCVATLALVAAVGGTAFAAGTISGSDIRDKTITGSKLKNQAVGTAQLKDFGVQTRDLQNGAVGTSQLRSSAVTGAKIAPGAVSSSDLARGAVGTAAIQNGAVTRADLALSARVPKVVVRTSPIVGVLDGALGDAQATCYVGETLLSGGAAVLSTPRVGIQILTSRPEAAPGGTAPQRWQGVVANQSGGTIQFQTTAVCATTSS